MRRSKAPSMMLNKTKRLCNFNNKNGLELENHGSEPEDEDYNWGSCDHNGKMKSKSNEHKTIFSIVWRDVSNKKHKTWKGDGTLEINEFATKAILKDECGKYLGCSTNFNKSELCPDFQMIVGGKEIEIQTEIRDEDELNKLWKRQVESRNWGDEEWISPEDLSEEQKKPKGGFKFKPLLILKSPETVMNNERNIEKKNYEWKIRNSQENLISSKTANLTSSSSHIRKEDTFSACTEFRKELLCFIRPSELQKFLFQKVLEYYSTVKSSLTLEKIESLDIYHILLHICNHPSFINHKASTNELIRYLIPNLPDWSEMGPFDSGKLEFVQSFLNNILQSNFKSCIILAKSLNTTNMLQGLCDFMNIKCLRLNSNYSEDNIQQILTEFCSMDNTLPHILLVNSLNLLKNMRSFDRQRIIVFEDSSTNIEFLNIPNNLQNFIIYYLVTAFSIEELLLLDNNRNIDRENLFEILRELINLTNIDDTCCYLHSKIECKCIGATTTTDKYNNDGNMLFINWKHCTNPFDEELLKVAFLENSVENIITIFLK